jgi:thioredoxin reductase (NADPH)
MMNSAITVIAPGELVELIGKDDISQIAVDHFDGSDAPVTHDCDLVVAALGFSSSLGPLLDWGLDFSGRHIVVAPTMQTSRERVYAVGDVSTYPGKVRLISVGFGEAAIAVNHIAADLDPTAQLFPGHSTSTEE